MTTTSTESTIAAPEKVGNELDFTFKVNLVAVVRVRADDESVARKIVPTVLGAPGTAEIRLANENNAAKGHHATVTDVDFSIGSVVPARNSMQRSATPLRARPLTRLTAKQRANYSRRRPMSKLLGAGPCISALFRARCWTRRPPSP